jgi:hypothetical protein
MTGSTRTPRRVVLSGPLSGYGPGFAAALEEQCFMPLSVEHQLRRLAHLSRWMHNHRLVVGQLTGVQVDEFLIERRASYTASYSPRALRGSPGRTSDGPAKVRVLVKQWWARSDTDYWGDLATAADDPKLALTLEDQILFMNYTIDLSRSLCGSGRARLSWPV